MDTHRLHLHRINSGNPSHRLLIKRHRRRIALGRHILTDNLGQQRRNPRPHSAPVNHRNSSTETGHARISAVVVDPTMNVRSGECP